MSKGTKSRLELIGYMLIPIAALLLFALTVGVANGNVHLHWPTWHEVGQFFISSLAD